MATNRFGPLQDNPDFLRDDTDEAITSMMRQEIARSEEQEVFVTEDVSWIVRDIVKRARKYYYGIFDKPFDEVTGEEKTFVPLSESTVNRLKESIDLDYKDLRVRPRIDRAVGPARAMKFIVDHFMNKIRFGELLDMWEFMSLRDGTVVVKSWLDKGELKTRTVDVLNFYIESHADNIQDAGWCAERTIMSIDDFKKMNWDNIDLVEGKHDVRKADRFISAERSDVPIVEVYERWGKMPKSFITKNPEDADKWIDGVAIVSNLFDAPVVHKVMKNPFKDGRKPYEELRIERVDGRWAGRGAVEKLFPLQYYLNQIVNIRRNNALVLQNGIFEVRRGSGITPDMVDNIHAGGAILVNRLGEDIRQLPVQDVRASSYRDEEVIVGWSQRVTGTTASPQQDITASTPATTALVKQQGERNTFAFAQKQIGHFIERLFERHYIPLIVESLKEGDVLRITGNLDELKELDEAIVNREIEKSIMKRKSAFSEEVIEQEREKARGRLRRFGDMRFLKIKKSLFDTDFDIQVDIDTEEIDRTVMVQQLKELLFTVARAFPETNLDTNAVLREILDLMGLQGARFFKEQPEQLAQPSALDARTEQVRTQTAPTEEDVFARAAAPEERVGIGGGARPPQTAAQAPTLGAV